MAKFVGNVGFAEVNVETSPGVFEDTIVEKKFYGDIVQDTRRFLDGSTIVDSLQIDNTISILTNAYANVHRNAMRYVVIDGVRWEIASIEIRRPRLLLRLGGVYNGPTPHSP